MGDSLLHKIISTARAQPENAQSLAEMVNVTHLDSSFEMNQLSSKIYEALIKLIFQEIIIT
jgi:hypothetical protein